MNKPTRISPRRPTPFQRSAKEIYANAGISQACKIITNITKMHQIRKRPTQDNQGQAKQTNKQTHEQASKSINRQEIHHEAQHLSSDLQRNLMRMQEFHKHAKSLQIQPKCITSEYLRVSSSIYEYPRVCSSILE